MKNEKQDSYEVILNCLAEVYESLSLEPPRTILTDKEQALMNAIETVFPTTKNMICLWHINMNIMKKARPILSQQIKQALQEADSTQASSTQVDSSTQDTSSTSRRHRRTKAEKEKEIQEKVDEGWKKMLQHWSRVVFATTYEEFKHHWESFKEHYSDPIFQPLVEYIQSEWIDDYPEQFLHFHTKQYLHLNEIATSRTEGGHWLLKQDLQVSTNDLLVVLQTFERVVKLQF